MYSVVRADGYASTLWFVLWILIGKYTFLSLFLAVTLEAFDNRQADSAAAAQLSCTCAAAAQLSCICAAAPAIR